MTDISFATIQAMQTMNKDRLLEIMRQFNPHLYLYALSAVENGVPHAVNTKINRSLGILSSGSGYGKVTVFMQDGVVTQLKSEESVAIEEKIEPPERVTVTSTNERTIVDGE